MRRVLIANRGEIAVRIAHACREAGLVSIAVYADADRDALHVRAADEAYALHGETAADTYLNISKLLAVAAASKADAVHPGYGFLAENAAFAQAVREAGLTWIGPSAETIALLADKVAARRIACDVGVPVMPGTGRPVTTAAEVADFARSHGYPVAVKAAHGGGGRGMRIVHDTRQIPELLEAAVREAASAFGRGDCFVERYVARPRHVETQCLADAHGNVAVLSTRDCSIQRRHQKLVEEAPAPGLTPHQWELLREGSAAILRTTGYVGAATCEFLLAEDGTLSFLEVNTRLQVEHPVTEEVTGVDLVQEMLRIADGQRLERTDFPVHGHAVEFRITAEDPHRGFAPVAGRLDQLVFPTGPGIRVDTGYQQGDTVPPHFDSLIAKLIVRGDTRAHALARARRALADVTVAGVPTLLPFHRALLDTPEFTADVPRIHTRWVETSFPFHLLEELPRGTAPAQAPPSESRERVLVEVNGQRFEVSVPTARSTTAVLPRPRRAARTSPPSRGGSRAGTAVTAPTPATVVKVVVADGDAVQPGDTLLLVEAMKMEQPITAHRAGIVRGLAVEAGTPVAQGDLVCEIVDAPEADR
ncbi:putative acyl-CoA carboxylase complex A subunit [Thermobifida fusca YX]|uniref:Putative acyl-CoA carboxylase complex A subunit n=2 Tax=Thermobifida fusca TaxID=2021 RepID=Q47QK3_THEFY|nr:putative acyl-CoA carboxylase complex A subunit [Thermobifida fusca YX]